MTGNEHSRRQGLLRRTRYAQRQLVAGRWVHPQVTHGLLSSYQNWGCRCVPCTEASHEARADRYARLAAVRYAPQRQAS